MASIKPRPNQCAVWAARSSPAIVQSGRLVLIITPIVSARQDGGAERSSFEAIVAT